MALFSDKEECRTCKVLQEALEFERARNKELTETLTSLIKPTPIIQQNVDLKPIPPRGLAFTRRRAELEKADRLRAEAEQSPHRAVPDNEITKSKELEKLEREVGIVDSEDHGETNEVR